MKFIYKTIAISLLAIGASFLFSQNTFAAKSYPAQSQAFYVNDLASVIDDSTEQYIIDSNKKLAPTTGAQIVVMTVKSLDGESIEEYAHGVFEQYGIGASDRNNGTLILLAVEDRQSRIELGRGTEGFITDAESGRIQDYYMIPDFKNNNWNEGLRKGFDAVLARYEKEYEIDISESANIENIEDDSDEAIMYFGIFIAGIALAKILKGFNKIRNVPAISGAILAMAGLMFPSLFGETIASYVLTAGFGLLAGALFTLQDFLFGSSHYHGGGWSSGHSSGHSSGSFGGGGHSSGGGSSRSF